MSHRGFCRLMLFGALTISIVASKDLNAQDKEREGARADESAANGAWTPIVTLRDTSNKFPGDNRIERPKDGWWVAPIHAQLLADGTVLVTGWNRPEEKLCRDHQGRLFGTSFLLDPKSLDVKKSATLKITPLDEMPRKEGDVLYCAGHAPLADGRILFMGGARYKNLGIGGFPGLAGEFDEKAFKQEEFGLNYARLYDPRAGKFARVKWTNPGGPEPRPSPEWALYEKGAMWYPTNTRLPGGKALVNGGYARWISVLNPRKWEYLNRSVMLFDSTALDAGKNPWRTWVSHDKAPPEVCIDVFDYPHVFVLPRPVTVDGLPREVAMYGGLGGDPTNKDYVPGITFLSLDERVPEGKRFARPRNAARPKGGMLHETTASMTADGSIVIMGGGANGLSEGQRIDVYDPYKDDWRSVDTRITRTKPSSTVLPDGSVLILNGEEYWETPKNVGDLTRPTLFEPRTSKVTTLAPWADDTSMRGYHAISLLLKDGRVLIGGGRIYSGRRGDAAATGTDGTYRIGCERPEFRVFSPPYLFKGNRPVIGEGAPTTMTIGAPQFTMKYQGPALRTDGGVVLMALGAYTHSFDQNQRIVPLKATVRSPGEVTVTPPSDHWVAPEGDYNLFLVSDKGVPSVGVSVRVVGQRR